VLAGVCVFDMYWQAQVFVLAGVCIGRSISGRRLCLHVFVFAGVCVAYQVYVLAGVCIRLVVAGAGVCVGSSWCCW
jgi:hypothetical protein